MSNDTDELTRLREGAAVLAADWETENDAMWSVAASDLRDLVADPESRQSLAMAVVELRNQRDQARRIAVALEQENAVLAEQVQEMASRYISLYAATATDRLAARRLPRRPSRPDTQATDLRPVLARTPRGGM